MLDYSKIRFNEVDKDKPTQVFYSYDLTELELDKFLANYIEDGEIPEDETVKSIELCLTIYSKNDYKLEAVCNILDSNGDQIWINIMPQIRNADEFLILIPIGIKY